MDDVREDTLSTVPLAIWWLLLLSVFVACTSLRRLEVVLVVSRSSSGAMLATLSTIWSRSDRRWRRMRPLVLALALVDLLSEVIFWREMHMTTMMCLWWNEE